MSRQLGHKDPSITLRVYAHWLPDVSHVKYVDALDDTSSDVTQASPRASSVVGQNVLSRLGSVVTQNFASWNRIGDFLRRLEALNGAA